MKRCCRRFRPCSPIRFAILRSLVLLVGVFAWRTTRSGWGSGLGDKAWRGLGYLVLAFGIVFMFVFVPAPVLIVLWAVGLTVREARHPSEA